MNVLKVDVSNIERPFFYEESKEQQLQDVLVKEALSAEAKQEIVDAILLSCEEVSSVAKVFSFIPQVMAVVALHGPEQEAEQLKDVNWIMEGIIYGLAEKHKPLNGVPEYAEFMVSFAHHMAHELVRGRNGEFPTIAGNCSRLIKDQGVEAWCATYREFVRKSFEHEVSAKALTYTIRSCLSFAELVQGISPEVKKSWALKLLNETIEPYLLHQKPETGEEFLFTLPPVKMMNAMAEEFMDALRQVSQVKTIDWRGWLGSIEKAHLGS